MWSQRAKGLVNFSPSAVTVNALLVGWLASASSARAGGLGADGWSAGYSGSFKPHLGKIQPPSFTQPPAGWCWSAPRWQRRRVRSLRLRATCLSVHYLVSLSTFSIPTMGMHWIISSLERNPFTRGPPVTSILCFSLLAIYVTTLPTIPPLTLQSFPVSLSSFPFLTTT